MTDLVLTREIAASPEVVFEFLIDAQKLVQWLGLTASIDPTPGGEFTVDITGGDIALGTYVEITPNRRCVFTWGWDGSDEVPPGSSTVTIELEPADSGTMLTLTHAGLPEEAAVGHGGGWNYFLDRLTAAATGSQNPPINVDDIHNRSPEDT